MSPIRMSVAVGLGLLIASFALGAHASTSPLAQSAPPAEGFGRLKGFVLDRGGARIPAAVIVIEAENFVKESGYTEDGSYQVDLPAGSYRVTVRSDGFYPLRRERVRVSAGTTKTLNFRLRGARRGGR